VVRQHIAHVVVLAMGLSITIAARGDIPQAPGDAPETQVVTVTGCVTEGTDPGVYVLSHATAKPDIQNTPRTFRLVSGGAALDFTLHANHQVQTSGVAELKVTPDPRAGRADPRDLPAFAARTMHNVSERCLTGY
jgi:hypothetical protein